ncbi:MAG: PaREP1/PaREP8 domain-containing protein [Gemmatimonadota bacterium]|nr:PaREP1/PaREP8 domain-containing protein [Gemmatimonadota bacterium]
MTTMERYTNTSAMLLEQAEIELEAGDLVQASEKFWGAAAQALKATAQSRGWSHDSHAHFYHIIRKIIDETGDDELLDFFNAANLLHVNFYEGLLRLHEIRTMADRVRSLIRRLDGLNAT